LRRQINKKLFALGIAVLSNGIKLVRNELNVTVNIEEKKAASRRLGVEITCRKLKLGELLTKDLSGEGR